MFPTDRYTRAQAADASVSDTGGDRRVTVALSSEAPVKREYGDEILDHSNGAIDLDFIGSGRAPLLLEHEPGRQVGVVERVRLDADRVMRAVIRFGKSALASEILDDLKDGIRCNISLGYHIEEYEPLPEGKGYRITKWRPVEASIVSIPADTYVGVGRSSSVGKSMNTKHEAEARGEAIGDLITLAATHNLRSEMDDFLTPEVRTRSADAIRAAGTGFILSKLNGKPLASGDAPAVHTTGKRTYSIGKLIASQVPGANVDAGYEIEVAQEQAVAAKRAGRPVQGLLVPAEAFATRAVQTTANLGGMFGMDHMSGLFVKSLKPHAAVIKLGATVINGAADRSIPKWESGSTVAWVAENAAPADSAPVAES